MLDLFFGISITQLGLSSIGGRVLVIPGVIALVYLLHKCRKAKEGLPRILLLLSFVLYALVLIEILFFPVPFRMTEIVAERIAFSAIIPRSVSPVPFAILREGFSINTLLKNWAGNMLLIVPMGYYLPALFARFRSFLPALRAMALLLVLVEAFQFTLTCLVIRLPYRSTDVDDFIFGLLGGLIGYGIFSLFHKTYQRNNNLHE